MSDYSRNETNEEALVRVTGEISEVITEAAALVANTLDVNAQAVVGELRYISNVVGNLADLTGEVERLRGLLREAWPYVLEHISSDDERGAAAASLHDRIYTALPLVAPAPPKMGGG